MDATGLKPATTTAPIDQSEGIGPQFQNELVAQGAQEPPLLRDVDQDGLPTSVDLEAFRTQRPRGSYSSADIANYITSRPESIVFLGEDHGFRPQPVINDVVSQYTEDDKKVLFAAELPQEVYGDLFEQLNTGKIDIFSFIDEGLRINAEADEPIDDQFLTSVLDNVAVASRAGADVYAIDTATPEGSASDTLNRDAVMAARIDDIMAQAKDRYPGEDIRFVMPIGFSHVGEGSLFPQRRFDYPDLGFNGSIHPEYRADTQYPVSRRLAEGVDGVAAYGDDVLTVTFPIADIRLADPAAELKDYPFFPSPFSSVDAMIPLYPEHVDDRLLPEMDE